MNEVKFVDYKKTPGEKHHGIITILINNLVYVRYKVSPGKNGGWFPNIASYKISEYGVDSYIPAVVFESNMLKETVDACIKTNINRIMSQSPVLSVASSGAPESEIPF